ncbi:MAG: hypothetical protein HY718_21050 [Planctomycetes bacterium]|nr:hypothetical protein [Planctomycetota bacterium]
MNLLGRKWPFFGSSKPEPVPLTFRVCGKLPVIGDYCWWPGPKPTAGAAGRFVAWIHEGWEAIRDLERPPSVIAHRLWCSWGGPGGQVAAVLWQSRDGGTTPRAFPFACYATGVDVSTTPDWPARLGAMLSLWGRIELSRRSLADMKHESLLDSLCHEGHNMLTLEMPGESSSTLSRQAATIPLRDFAAAVGPGSDEGAIRRWLASLPGRVRQWSAQNSAQTQLAIRCPLSRQWPLPGQAVSWIEWLTAAMPAGSRPAAVLLSTDDEEDECAPWSSPGVTVCFRELKDVDLMLLTTSALDYAYLRTIPYEAPAEGPDDPAPPPSGETGPTPLNLDVSLWEWARS